MNWKIFCWKGSNKYVLKMFSLMDASFRRNQMKLHFALIQTILKHKMDAAQVHTEA
jgi:hypothetical protein